MGKKTWLFLRGIILGSMMEISRHNTDYQTQFIINFVFFFVSEYLNKKCEKFHRRNLKCE